MENVRIRCLDRIDGTVSSNIDDAMHDIDAWNIPDNAIS